MDKQYYTTKDIQNIFGLSRQNAYKLMDANGFPCMRLGRKRLVAVDELKRWMNKYNFSKFTY